LTNYLFTFYYLSKIVATERELNHLEVNKEALEDVADKYRQ